MGNKLIGLIIIIAIVAAFVVYNMRSKSELLLPSTNTTYTNQEPELSLPEDTSVNQTIRQDEIEGYPYSIGEGYRTSEK